MKEFHEVSFIFAIFFIDLQDCCPEDIRNREQDGENSSG